MLILRKTCKHFMTSRSVRSFCRMENLWCEYSSWFRLKQFFSFLSIIKIIIIILVRNTCSQLRCICYECGTYVGEHIWTAKTNRFIYLYSFYSCKVNAKYAFRIYNTHNEKKERSPGRRFSQWLNELRTVNSNISFLDLLKNHQFNACIFVPTCLMARHYHYHRVASFKQMSNKFMNNILL